MSSSSSSKTTSSKSSTASASRQVVVENKLGLHARPAAMFVREANKFASEIWVEKDGEKINGKSIMGLMLLAAGRGSKLKLMANGADATQAVDALEALLKSKFNEE